MQGIKKNVAAAKRRAARQRPDTPASVDRNAHRNHLLAALPVADFARIAPYLELIPMKLGDVLYEPGVRLRYVYFPTT